MVHYVKQPHYPTRQTHQHFYTQHTDTVNNWMLAPSFDNTTVSVS